jgi:hypothetical protein
MRSKLMFAAVVAALFVFGAVVTPASAQRRAYGQFSRGYGGYGSRGYGGYGTRGYSYSYRPYYAGYAAPYGYTPYYGGYSAGYASSYSYASPYGYAAPYSYRSFYGNAYYGR